MNIQSDRYRKKGKKEPEKIGDILTQVLEKTGLKEKFEEQKPLLVWNKIVGQTIALHTMPGWIKNGVLWIFVNDSIWQQELTFLETQIVEKVNQYLGGKKICRIKFIQKRAQ